LPEYTESGEKYKRSGNAFVHNLSSSESLPGANDQPVDAVVSTIKILAQGKALFNLFRKFIAGTTDTYGSRELFQGFRKAKLVFPQ
jgi:hypothetical protein